VQSLLPCILNLVIWIEHSLIILVFQALIPVAFYSVLERKVMASVQRRRGPNVVGFWGSMQAAADGAKLVAKEGVFPRGIVFATYIFAPAFALIISFSC
jgi:NADH:ubiquinone oxidoreductase subunit H